MLVAACFAGFGCDLLKSATATTVVAGLVVKTPGVGLAGKFAVSPEVLTTVWLGERESGTSTEAPEPLAGGHLQLVFAGNIVTLKPHDSEAGLYETTSLVEPNLVYQGGTSYAFVARRTPTDDTNFGGSVVAPDEVTEANLVTTPILAPRSDIPSVKIHHVNTDLRVRWTAANGRFAYVTVFRSDANNLTNPEVVFDNQPETAQEYLDFIVGPPQTETTIAGSHFDRDGVYAVVIVVLDRGTAKTNTFIGSPFLAGSGAAILMTIGEIEL